MKKVIPLIGLILLPSIGHTATGDILFSCTFDEPGSSASQVVAACGASGSSGMDTYASIVQDGHDGKKAISYYYPNTGSEIVYPFTTPPLNKQEITVDYWEKFDVNPTSSTIWNVKSIRPYVGPGGNDYMAAIMSLHNGGKFYQSTWGGSGTLNTSSNVSYVKLDQLNYCTGTGNTYTCPNGRMELAWSPGWGTQWHNIRVYIKVPSSATTFDGQTTVWIDGKLVYNLTNIGKSSLWSTGWVPYTTNIRFHPSDDFFVGVSGSKFPFHHLYDDIKVYEGYVPVKIAAPQAVKIASVTK